MTKRKFSGEGIIFTVEAASRTWAKQNGFTSEICSSAYRTVATAARHSHHHHRHHHSFLLLPTTPKRACAGEQVAICRMWMQPTCYPSYRLVPATGCNKLARRLSILHPTHPIHYPHKTTPHPPTHLQSQPSQTRLEGPRLRGRQDGGSVRAPCVRVSFQSARVSCYKDAGCPLLEMSFTGTSRENAYRLLRQHCGNFHWRIGWVAT